MRVACKAVADLFSRATRQSMTRQRALMMLVVRARLGSDSGAAAGGLSCRHIAGQKLMTTCIVWSIRETICKG